MDARSAPGFYVRMDVLIRKWSGSDSRIPFEAKNDVMSYELYEAVRTQDRNVHDFQCSLERVCAGKQLDLSIIFDQVTPSGDSLLHVAAEFGRKEIAELIAYFFPKLLYKTNTRGDSPLHVAARAKNNDVMEIILFKFENIDRNNLILSENKYRNTPLHEAVLSKNFEGVDILLKAHDDSALAHYWNNIYPKKSPMYLAVLTGNVEILRRLLQIPSPSDLAISNCSGNSPLHAAILERNPELLQEIMNVREDFMHMRDEKEETPLHWAARIGYMEGVCIMLRKSTSIAFLKNSDGNLPIHLACERGHVQVVQKLLLPHGPWPNVGLLLNNKGQNILHIAAINGEKNVLKYLLRSPEIYGETVNERDINGDTPLHLASRNLCLWTLLLLSRHKKIDVSLVNNQGLTARDIIRMQCKIPMKRQEFLADMILKGAGVPLKGNYILGVGCIASINREWNVKDAANTLILAAILIATVTFTAGFTVPGGIHDSDHQDKKEIGKAVCANQIWFKIFMTFNTVAMYSSTMGFIILLWVQLGDRRFAEGVYRFAKVFVYVALITMPVAFLASIWLIISNETLLVDVVSSIGFIFIFFILFVRILGRFPLGSRLPFIHQAGDLFIRIILVLFYGKNDILIGKEGEINQNDQDDRANQVNPFGEKDQVDQVRLVHLNYYSSTRNFSGGD